MPRLLDAAVVTPEEALAEALAEVMPPSGKIPGMPLMVAHVFTDEVLFTLGKQGWHLVHEDDVAQRLSSDYVSEFYVARGKPRLPIARRLLGVENYDSSPIMDAPER